jgi:hypothetical protein
VGYFPTAFEIRSRRPEFRHLAVVANDNRGRRHIAGRTIKAVITVIIGGRALLMLIAARFSGSGSGKDLSEPRDLADRLRPAAVLAARVRARQEIA